jgi:hypothetical protein
LLRIALRLDENEPGRCHIPIDFKHAHEIAVGLLRRIEAESGIALAMRDEHRVAHNSGWIFYWNTESFVKTGDNADPIAGNSPIVVFNDGTIRQAPSAYGDVRSILGWLSEHPESSS